MASGNDNTQPNIESESESKTESIWRKIGCFKIGSEHHVICNIKEHTFLLVFTEWRVSPIWEGGLSVFIPKKAEWKSLGVNISGNDHDKILSDLMNYAAMMYSPGFCQTISMTCSCVNH